MNIRLITVVVFVLFTSGCAAGLFFDGTAGFAMKRKAMWAIQSDVNNGVVTPVSVAGLPIKGSADFAGHFLISDNATGGREILFGDVSMNYQFGAPSNQLTGKLRKIMLVDNEGQKVYGLATPKIMKKFSGSLALAGSVDTNSVPLAAGGNLVDDNGMTLLADPSFYQDKSGNFVLSSPWASGTLTRNGGKMRKFDAGYLGARQSP